MYYFLLFFYFIGLGANLSSISPYILSHFGQRGEWVFVFIQFSNPIGNLFGGWISDKTKKLRIYLIICLFAVSPVQYFLFSFPNSWLITFFLAGVQRFLLSANYQWLSIAALESKGEHNFSKIRSAGTIGFFVAQLFLFLCTLPEFGSVFQTSAETGKIGAIGYLICLLFCKDIPVTRKSKAEYRFKDAFRLVSHKHFLYFFLLSFFYYATYQITDNYLGRFFEISLGLGSVYLSWGIAVIFEIPFLILIPKIVFKFGAYSLFYFSLISGIIRFGFFALVTTAANPELLYLIQFSHSLFFAGFYMGAVYWLRHHSPIHLYGSVYGLFSILTQSLGGMFGNLITGNILHRKYGRELELIFTSGRPESLDFFPIFLLGFFNLVILLYGFYLLNKKFSHIGKILTQMNS